jgi:hypothetical protein
MLHRVLCRYALSWSETGCAKPRFSLISNCIMYVLESDNTIFGHSARVNANAFICIIVVAVYMV